MSKTNTKKTNNKKSTTNNVKIDIEKINIAKMNDNERETMKNHLLSQLKNAINRRDKCRIRQQLRKYCQHYGALRNRTYVDKTTNERHIVERANVNDNTTQTTTTTKK